MTIPPVKKLFFPVSWLVLFSFLIYMMAGHFRSIAVSNDPMDEEISLLKNIKDLIPSGSQAAFTTNISNIDEATLIYYQTQFACCPLILSSDVSHCDNIIFYRSYSARDSDMNFAHHWDTLYQASGKEYTVMLLHKTKSK